MDTMEDDGHKILCCHCAVAIEPNAINMCSNCLQSRYDIGAGVSKQVQQNTCRGCLRFERRDGSWAVCEPESKELLALLLKKPRGLGAVRLADATFVWTEPHSRRIKLRTTIQKEVVAGAVLQQTFVIEYVLGNKQCTNCQRKEAKDTWTAVVQVRQKVPHKRTFLWIEQLILRHNAHADTVNITEVRDGLDFFFDQRSHAEKLVSFLQSVAPTRYKTSKQMVSQDVHTGKGKTKLTYSVEVLPICKDDLCWLPRPTAGSLGQISQLVLCSKVSNVVHLVDPLTLQPAELQPMAFWKNMFKPALSRANLVEFVVLDVELHEEAWRTSARPLGSRGRDAHTRADVTVARRSDFGRNDRRAAARTHLGNLLKAGDHVWGYCVTAAAGSADGLEEADESKLPEVVLVKKSYSDRRHKARRRLWKLRSLEKESEPGVMRGRQHDTTAYDMQYEQFMQDLEEDPSMRAQINMYKDDDAIDAYEAEASRPLPGAPSSSHHPNSVFASKSPSQQPPPSSAFAPGAPAAAAATTSATPAAASSAAAAPPPGIAEDDDDDDDDDDDFPDVGLEELLDDLTLEAGGEEGAPEPHEPEVSQVTFAPTTPQFEMPGGNSNAKFHF